MHFILEIFQGNRNQDHIHRKFVRYGRGEFEGPAMVIKNSGGRLRINASDEYVNLLGGILTRNSSQGFNFSGDVISKDDVRNLLQELGIAIEKSAKKKGIFSFRVKGSLPAEKLSGLYSGLEGSYLFLDLTSTDGKSKLKTKKKPPKPGSGADLNFCSATLDSTLTDAIMNEILFDMETGGFREVKIYHSYTIDELLIPDEYRGDFALARIHAKRKGTIKRVVEIDGEKTEIEHELIV
jgi:hypothetical protein